MVYFVSEILFTLYFIFYSMLLFIDKPINNEKNWIIFLFLIYFSFMSLWLLIKSGLYFSNVFFTIDKFSIFIKCLILFTSFIGSFFLYNIIHFLQVVIYLIFGCLLISVKSIFMVPILFSLLDITNSFVQYNEKKFVSRNTVYEASLAIMYIALAMLIFNNEIVFLNTLSYFLIFFSLYIRYDLGLFYSLINAPNQIAMSRTINCLINNIFILGIMTKFLITIEFINPMFLAIGLIDLVIGTSIIFMQTNIRKIINGIIIIQIGSTLILAKMSQNAYLIMLYHMSFTIPIISFVAVICYLLRNKVLVNIHDMAGIISKDIKLGISVLISLLSLMGIPFTMGFFGKLLILNLVIINNYLIIMLAILINQIIITISYLKIIKIIILDKYMVSHDKLKFGKYFIGLIIINIMIIFYALYSSWIMNNIM